MLGFEDEGFHELMRLCAQTNTQPTTPSPAQTEALSSAAHQHQDSHTNIAIVAPPPIRVR